MLSNFRKSSKSIIKYIPKKSLLFNTEYTEYTKSRKRYYSIDTICDNMMNIGNTFIMSSQICGVMGYSVGGIYGFKVLLDIHMSLWDDAQKNDCAFPLLLLIPNFMFTPVICGGIGGIIGVLYPITFPMIYNIYTNNKKS